METDLSEVKSQQEALRVEVSEALKVIHVKSKPKFENKDDNVKTKVQVAAPKPTPARATAVESPPVVPPTVQQNKAGDIPPMLERDNLLFVGDSILHNANFNVIENSTGTNVRTAKAYAADYDLKTRFPNKNVVYVARNEAKKKPYKYVFLQSPSVHITNLNTMTMMMLASTCTKTWLKNLLRK